jgi:hypothetical protein
MDTSNKWTVWRQDDHGNRVAVQSELSCDQAESLFRQLEARGHKQTYWIEAAAADNHITSRSRQPRDCV